MLIDIPTTVALAAQRNWHERADVAGVDDETVVRLCSIERVRRGCYIAGLNYEHLLPKGYFTDQYPFDILNFDKDPTKRIVEFRRRWENNQLTESYGVCDDVVDVINRFPEIEDDPRSFVIFLHPVYHADQPPHNGWRWHKWGAYYGQHEPQYEYLAEEEGIEMVYCFQILEIQPDGS